MDRRLPALGHLTAANVSEYQYYEFLAVAWASAPNSPPGTCVPCTWPGWPARLNVRVSICATRDDSVCLHCSYGQNNATVTCPPMTRTHSCAGLPKATAPRSRWSCCAASAVNPTPAATAARGGPNCWTPPPKPAKSTSGGPEPVRRHQAAYAATATSCRSSPGASLRTRRRHTDPDNPGRLPTGNARENDLARDARATLDRLSHPQGSEVSTSCGWRPGCGAPACGRPAVAGWQSVILLHP